MSDPPEDDHIEPRQGGFGRIAHRVETDSGLDASGRIETRHQGRVWLLERVSEPPRLLDERNLAAQRAVEDFIEHIELQLLPGDGRGMLAGDRDGFEEHLEAMTTQFRATGNPSLIQQCDKLAAQAVTRGLRAALTPTGMPIIHIDTTTMVVLSEEVSGVRVGSGAPKDPEPNPLSRAVE